MIRTLAVLVVISYACGTALPAAEPAPPPRPKKPTLYFPTTVGTKWVYETPSQKDEWTQVITDVKEKEGVYIVTHAILTKEDKLVGHLKVAVSDRGIILMDDDKVDFDSPELSLKLPYKEDLTWGNNDKYRLLKIERVKVPAGVFEAIPVEATPKDARLNGIIKWYAPGVGMIKMAANSTSTGTVLKSFTPGKE